MLRDGTASLVIGEGRLVVGELTVPLDPEVVCVVHLDEGVIPAVGPATLSLPLIKVPPQPESAARQICEEQIWGSYRPPVPSHLHFYL